MRIRFGPASRGQCRKNVSACSRQRTNSRRGWRCTRQSLSPWSLRRTSPCTGAFRLSHAQQRPLSEEPQLLRWQIGSAVAALTGPGQKRWGADVEVPVAPRSAAAAGANTGLGVGPALVIGAHACVREARERHAVQPAEHCARSSTISPWNGSGSKAQEGSARLRPMLTCVSARHERRAMRRQPVVLCRQRPPNVS